VAVHGFGFTMFLTYDGKLLKIEQNFTKKSFKSKLTFIKEFKSTLLVFLESL
jgi:hypothetical protein